jgi:hypothetical protein
MITFRDGPTGRRAGLIGGADVWEVAMWIDDLGSVKDPAAELASDGVVTRPQIDAVLAYRAAYPDEIQARIALHRVAAPRLAGASDAEVFGAAVAGGYAVLTENVADFAPIAAEHSTGGGHHHGLLIALSSRFSRRRAGIPPLVAAIQMIANEQIEDRVIPRARPAPITVATAAIDLCRVA